MPRTADVPSDGSVKVRVPQDSGAVIVNTFDGPAQEYAVTNGIITVDTKAEADRLVTLVDGASLA